MPMISDCVAQSLLVVRWNDSHDLHQHAFVRWDIHVMKAKNNAPLRTHKARCVNKGVAFQWRDRDNFVFTLFVLESATSRIHLLMIFSTSASRCLLRLPLSFVLLPRSWDAQMNVAILLRLIVAITFVVVDAIVSRDLYSWSWLTACRCRPYKHGERERRDGGRHVWGGGKSGGYCITRNFSKREYSRLAYARQQSFALLYYLTPSSGIVNLSRNLSDKLSNGKKSVVDSFAALLVR